jgi:hypothetical protein
MKKKPVKVTLDGKTGNISDGYHTFDELYEHRVTLFIMLCRHIDEATPVWRSKVHSDGTSIKGFFLLGIAKRKGAQISYHLPMGHWDDTAFAETLDRAPAWDSHTPQDVLRRLKRL